MSCCRILPPSFVLVLCLFLAAGAAAEPGRGADNATALASIQETLAGHAFSVEPHRLTGSEASERRLTFAVDGIDTVEFLRSVASAAGWSVIFDTSARHGSAGTLTLDLKDVAWDVVVETVLKRQGLRAVRVGEIWLVASRERAAETVRRIDPSTFVRRVVRASSETLTAALSVASSEQGVVVWNRRLGVVVVADRIDTVPDYARVWTAIEGEAAPSLPSRSYSGESINMSLESAALTKTLESFAKVAGLNLVLPENLDGSVSLHLVTVAWDNVLDVLLLSFGLTFHVEENVVQVRPLRTGELRVETILLENEEPSFFAPFKRCLTADGELVIDPETKTLILRDHESRAVWMRKLIERIDGMVVEKDASL